MSTPTHDALSFYGPAIVRLFSRVQIDGESGCWNWTGKQDKYGYGALSFRRDGANHTRYAHRVAYEVLIGPVPSGLELDHTCRNPSCVNPSHLDPVTHVENMRRAYVARTLPERCPRGHVFDAENTYRGPSGKRQCRACSRERAADSYALRRRA